MRSKAAILSSAFALTLCVAASAAGEVIDRIVAIVNGSVITLSDVEGARRFGLIAADAGDLRSGIERLIDRRLALVEVERYAPPEPPETGIDEAIAATRGKFASDAAFAAALAETGLSMEQLRRHFRDDLRRHAYEQQRFAFTPQPSEEEALAYYRKNQDRFRRGSGVAPYDDVRAEVLAAVVAERRAESIREWLASLRRRADISILPIS